MAHIVLAYIVMAYIVMALYSYGLYIVTAFAGGSLVGATLGVDGATSCLSSNTSSWIFAIVPPLAGVAAASSATCAR